MNELQKLKNEAAVFLKQLHQELELPGLPERLASVEQEINETQTYWHLPHELEYGARLAWRNSNRCIGRLFWKSLVVHDLRQIRTPESVMDGLSDHLKKATNKGKIIPMISVFAPKDASGNIPVRIWNKHLIRYACFNKPDGSTIGDPEQKEFTQVCEKMGWQGSQQEFDILPVIIQCQGMDTKWFNIPKELILEVSLEHPSYDWFSELALKWPALPMLSDMTLEIGGIQYPAAPFNGWYMVTEIGSRNLGDVNRYNLLPVIADKMGIRSSNKDPFWKDKALVLLNEAVYYSFKKKGATLTDHHSASEQFMKFMQNEMANGRNVTADWSWIVPPMSGSAMEVFHTNFDNKHYNPNFYYTEPAWSTLQ